MSLVLNIATVIQDSELKPIMEPSPVEFKFETIGWSILLWLFIILTLLLLIRTVISYRKNKYKRDALKVLEKLTIDSPKINEQIATQLKLVAIQSYGRETVAHLSGSHWVSFLQSKNKHIKFENLETFLMECLYQNKVNPEQSEQFLTFSKKWIKSHA